MFARCGEGVGIYILAQLSLAEKWPIRTTMSVSAIVLLSVAMRQETSSLKRSYDRIMGLSGCNTSSTSE